MRVRISFLTLGQFILGLFLDFGKVIHWPRVFPFARWGNKVQGPSEDGVPSRHLSWGHVQCSSCLRFGQLLVSQEAAGWPGGSIFPPSSLCPHPEGKKFTRAAIRRGLSGGRAISLWFYYLKSVRCPGWGIFQGV